MVAIEAKRLEIESDGLPCTQVIVIVVTDCCLLAGSTVSSRVQDSGLGGRQSERTHLGQKLLVD